jgi:hypothetical protein
MGRATPPIFPSWAFGQPATGAKHGSQCPQTPPDSHRPLPGVWASDRPNARLHPIYPNPLSMPGGQGVAGSNPAVPTQVKGWFRSSGTGFLASMGAQMGALLGLDARGVLALTAANTLTDRGRRCPARSCPGPCHSPGARCPAAFPSHTLDSTRYLARGVGGTQGGGSP